MLNNKRIQPGIPEKIIKRVGKLPTSDLNDWADQALYSAGRCLSAFEKTRDPAQLQEAQTASHVLYAIMEEIVRRESR